MTPDPPIRTVDDMTTSRSSITAGLICGALVLASCGGNDTSDATGNDAAPIGTTPDTSPTTEVTSAPETTAETFPPASDPTIPSTSADDQAWRDLADDYCNHEPWAVVVPLPDPATDVASMEAFVQTHIDAADTAPDVGAIELPPGPGRSPEDLSSVMATGRKALDRAMIGASAGDWTTVNDGTDMFLAGLGHVASAFASAGQTCGPADAGVAANAALNVSVPYAFQTEVGYDSVWVSQGFFSNSVVRIDPDSGETLATIEMPSLPAKLQPADGRMLVRTADSYEAVDAATNTVVGSLLKADVGPNADRSWAVDGALWICDGQRLHRYDPTTLESVAVVELGIDCGQVHATSEVAVAWTFNQDQGESGNSFAAFVDPLTNTVMGTVELAGDASVPIVLDDAVFFPPQGDLNTTVVDRSDWTVSATPDLGRFIDGGSQGAFDGTNIYVIADKPTGTITVIDPVTFEVIDEVKAITTAPSLNSLAATPGVLWAANNSGGLLQRFDTAG